MTAGLDQFHEGFFVDSIEALEAMESALQQLQPGTADRETIRTVFRVAHSIKGGAGMLGLDEIAVFTHSMETLLDELRAGRMLVTAAICETLLKCVDQLHAMITAGRRKQPADMAMTIRLQEQLRDLVAAGTLPAWNIRFKPMPELLNHGNDPLRLFADLAGLGPLQVRADCSRVPALADLDPAVCHIDWELTLATAKPRGAIELIFEWAAGDCELDIARAATPAATASAAASMKNHPAPAERLPAPMGDEATSIRVAIGKLDELLGAASEIAAIQATLSALAARSSGPLAEGLRAATSHLDTSARKLQEDVMRLRMLPVGSVFSRFPRQVRDLSARLGKQVRIQISGSQVELDKSVLEKIGDPLMHLVRNSVDHGIEAPALRLAAGKPEQGTVQLDARQLEDSILIIVADDGRGLDRSRLLQKARSGGMIDAEPVLSDAEVDELIFLPGLSTAEQANDVSGRGVGMDVVRRNIESLGGTVDLHSAPGQGTTITIQLPLTPAMKWRNAATGRYLRQ